MAVQGTGIEDPAGDWDGGGLAEEAEAGQGGEVEAVPQSPGCVLVVVARDDVDRAREGLDDVHGLACGGEGDGVAVEEVARNEGEIGVLFGGDTGDVGECIEAGLDDAGGGRAGPGGLESDMPVRSVEEPHRETTNVAEAARERRARGPGLVSGFRVPRAEGPSRRRFRRQGRAQTGLEGLR